MHCGAMRRAKSKDERAKLRLSHRQRLLADYVMAGQLKDRAAGLKSKEEPTPNKNNQTCLICRGAKEEKTAKRDKR